MSTRFSTRIRRSGRVSIFVLLAAASVGAWMLFGSPLASSAAPGNAVAIDTDIGAATAGLEALHQRAVSRSKAEDDDDFNRPTWGHAITPEQAASIAQQLARARGDTTTQHNFIELQTRNGRPAYAVRIGAGFIYIDADTGAVVL